ncbi:MAG: hypothetical protein M1370_00585 [Bacteroidetes bacterium]|nr:hypothetical protein [Bacteroidota bacterium]MCL5025231.1 hypothetical protein [Chloroflexota bacterium]
MSVRKQEKMLEPMGDMETVDSALSDCEELFQLSQELSTVIAAEDIVRLGEILDERQRLLSSLNLHDGSFRAGGRAASKRSLLVAKLQRLLQVDDENQRALKSWLAEMRTRLIEMSSARQALHKYAYLTPRNEPLYLDRRQ